MKLVIVTGLSGAGKTQALKTLEDIGFYCVDNLPPALVPNMAELAAGSGEVKKLALGVDVRSGLFFEQADKVLDELTAMGISYEVLFLDASEEELVRRYKETRRSHPMGTQELLEENIRSEKVLLEGIKKRADRLIDTTTMQTRQLRETLLRMYSEEAPDHLMTVNVLSFGFKYGMPQDADLVMDVRFIPNPYYIPEMRFKTGADKEVHDYVMQFDATKQFLQKMEDMMTFLIPNYASEGKDRLVLAIGCTGGQHRSVALAIEVAEMLKRRGYHSTVTHRDAEVK